MSIIDLPGDRQVFHAPWSQKRFGFNHHHRRGANDGDGASTRTGTDYRHDAQQKTMRLEADEFIRRFLLHVLPDGFQRIRYYGFLANRYREQKLTCCRELLGMPAPETPALETPKNYRERYEELTGSSLWQCPVCHRGRMLVIEILPRSPHRKMTTTDTS